MVFVHSKDSLFFSRTVKRFSDQIRRPVDIDVNIIDRMRTKMKKKWNSSNVRIDKENRHLIYESKDFYYQNILGFY